MNLRLLVLICLLLAACQVTASRRIHLPPAQEFSGVQVHTTKMVRLMGTYIGVAGRLVNLGERTIQSCTVSYDGLDMLSARIDVAEVTLGPIEPGESVAFEAIFRTRKTRELSRLQLRPPRIRLAD